MFSAHNSRFRGSIPERSKRFLDMDSRHRSMPCKCSSRVKWHPSPTGSWSTLSSCLYIVYCSCVFRVTSIFYLRNAIAISGLHQDIHRRQQHISTINYHLCSRYHWLTTESRPMKTHHLEHSAENCLHLYSNLGSRATPLEKKKKKKKSNESK
jgi:hypothetical protein